jgi:hypothetical protein
LRPIVFINFCLASLQKLGKQHLLLEEQLLVRVRTFDPLPVSVWPTHPAACVLWLNLTVLPNLALDDNIGSHPNQQNHHEGHEHQDQRLTSPHIAQALGGYLRRPGSILSGAGCLDHALSLSDLHGIVAWPYVAQAKPTKQEDEIDLFLCLHLGQMTVQESNRLPN